MFKSVIKIVSLLGLLASFQVRAADPIVVGVDAENPPFMSSVAGKAAGLYPAIIAEALQTAGVAAKLEAKPWKRCIADMDDGSAGVGGIYKNEERLKKWSRLRDVPTLVFASLRRSCRKPQPRQWQCVKFVVTVHAVDVVQDIFIA